MNIKKVLLITGCLTTIQVQHPIPILDILNGINKFFQSYPAPSTLGVSGCASLITYYFTKQSAVRETRKKIQRDPVVLQELAERAINDKKFVNILTNNPTIHQEIEYKILAHMINNDSLQKAEIQNIVLNVGKKHAEFLKSDPRINEIVQREIDRKITTHLNSVHFQNHVQRSINEAIKEYSTTEEFKKIVQEHTFNFIPRVREFVENKVEKEIYAYLRAMENDILGMKDIARNTSRKVEQVEEKIQGLKGKIEDVRSAHQTTRQDCLNANNLRQAEIKSFGDVIAATNRRQDQLEQENNKNLGLINGLQQDTDQIKKDAKETDKNVQNIIGILSEEDNNPDIQRSKLKELQKDIKSSEIKFAPPAKEKAKNF